MPFHVNQAVHENFAMMNGFKGPIQMTKDESEIPKLNKGNKKNLWYLDSGCSRHMTGDSIMLTGFRERAGPSITFGDDNKGYTVRYDLISKDNVIIEEVALVDGLKHNLLSISQLCDMGNSVTFNVEACVVTNKKSNKVVLNGNKLVGGYIKASMGIPRTFHGLKASRKGDDQWGIRPSTSRKGYLLVSLPDQQDIRFMPRYFLNLFGLRGLFSLIVGEENAIDDTQCIMQMSGFGFDPSKVEREVERDNEVARMVSVFSVLLLEQSLAQETRNPDHRLLASVNNHRRQLATSLETVKWQIEKMNRTKLPIRKRLGNVPQFPIGVDVAVAEIMDPIERPNAGPDDVHIEDVMVEDVVLDGIVAEEDLVKDLNKNE
ncbi:hypothetical protein AgCh_020080 [Apium graveolens]